MPSKERNVKVGDWPVGSSSLPFERVNNMKNKLKKKKWSVFREWCLGKAHQPDHCCPRPSAVALGSLAGTSLPSTAVG